MKATVIYDLETRIRKERKRIATMNCRRWQMYYDTMTGERISAEDCEAIVRRIAGEGFETRALIVPQVLSPLWQGGGYKAGVEIKQAA